MESTLHEMKLLHCTFLSWGKKNARLVRVPGGWMYEMDKGCSFIPLNNEFCEEKIIPAGRNGQSPIILIND